MEKFQNVLEVLEYNARCQRVSVALGTQGAFGATYEEAVKAQVLLDEYNEAIEILKASQ